MVGGTAFSPTGLGARFTGFKITSSALSRILAQKLIRTTGAESEPGLALSRLIADGVLVDPAVFHNHNKILAGLLEQLDIGDWISLDQQ